jgi:3-phenylpropionate/trans-cinnamate dioxygenase ferredoxin component
MTNHAVAEFVDVMPTADLPLGERVVVEVGREWVVIFNVGGQFYAIEDRCSHDDVELSAGELDGTTIQCPKHLACFNITNGDVLSAPALVGIKTFATRVVDDMLQIATK